MNGNGLLAFKENMKNKIGENLQPNKTLVTRLTETTMYRAYIMKYE